MKRYSLIVALHIIGIAFLSVGVYLLVDAGLWFSALMAFLILLAIAVHLYRLQMMQVRMMRHLAESLRYDDMMLSFRSPYKNRSMEDMVDELSEAMRNFRTRVLERNEMEAWQKLIRVLTQRNNEFNHSHHLPLRNLERAGNVGKEPIPSCGRECRLSTAVVRGCWSLWRITGS